ncbi:MAG TPA: hypothetical protein VM840_12175 [Actinomycetota bacterium]|nr:hypothetical protein [Actinomycetota bacterium]
MKIRWDKLGGQLGVGVTILGFIFIFMGWNGAASLDRVPSQFPYLISGGVAGICLVIVGSALMLIQNQREERAYLETRLSELQAAIERAPSVAGATALMPAVAGTGDGLVVAGASSYHLPDCHLAEGRQDAEFITPEDAEDRGLRPCRICKP